MQYQSSTPSVESISLFGTTITQLTLFGRRITVHELPTNNGSAQPQTANSFDAQSDEDVQIISRAEFYETVGEQQGEVEGVQNFQSVTQELVEDNEQNEVFPFFTYEELLALQEQIGVVHTGLSEQTISAGIKPHKYRSKRRGYLEKEVLCCICQEEYIRDQKLGMLDCGHRFHFSCIKMWLTEKNVCPLCKGVGLNI